MTDCVMTRNAYRCSVCGQERHPELAPEPVIRLTNVRPDFPPDCEKVDLLVCPDCLSGMEEASASESAPEMAFFRARLASETRS